MSDGGAARSAGAGVVGMAVWVSVMLLAAPATAGDAVNALAYCRGAAAKAFALSSSEPAATVAQAAIGHCLDKEPAARQEIVTSSGTFSPSEAQEMLDHMKRDPSVLISIIVETRARRASARRLAPSAPH